MRLSSKLEYHFFLTLTTYSLWASLLSSLHHTPITRTFVACLVIFKPWVLDFPTLAFTLFNLYRTVAPARATIIFFELEAYSLDSVCSINLSLMSRCLFLDVLSHVNSPSLRTTSTNSRHRLVYKYSSPWIRPIMIFWLSISAYWGNNNESR